ncbi:MAG: ATP-dependent helicase RecG [Eubacteriaceae bacterium]|nr:ATP-dependent helicase RecG [Eubacteriaceae bacterium]MDK2961803.1 ATP-dependent helicase RecG [Eubacteriaceae bacterium]
MPMKETASENSQSEYLEILENLIQNWESEVVEFKEAKSHIDDDKVGRYFSAISNEANLRGKQYGWLVLGVREADREIVGSAYKNNALSKFKKQISRDTTGEMTFVEIIEIYPEVNEKPKRVILFRIPAAASGIPTGWKNRYYGRSGDALIPLSQDKIDAIRNLQQIDWSNQVIEKSDLSFLDSQAIKIARSKYIKYMNKDHIKTEINGMSDAVFLTKLKLMRDGKLTNAAMLLLGNPSYDYVFDVPPQIMWRLYDANGLDKDYKIFDIPFITVVDQIYQNVRNLTYRYLPDQLTLFPEETQQYDPQLLREMLNNCIVHSNYTLGSRIYVNEFDDRIQFINPGNFLPGSIKPVLEPGYAPPSYRNPLLANIMRQFSMIDTAAMGIRKVYKIQKEKYFPMPDYNFERYNTVSATVYGKIIDENYTKLIYENPEFDLQTIYLIDRVQKHLSIDAKEIRTLRNLKVIEGKAPNIYLTPSIAQSIDAKAEYISNKGFDDQYYKDMIVEYLKTFERAQKKDISKLLWDKLPDVLNDKQKKYKIGNLLRALQDAELIERNNNNKRSGYWVLVVK